MLFLVCNFFTVTLFLGETVIRRYWVFHREYRKGGILGNPQRILRHIGQFIETMADILDQRLWGHIRQAMETMETNWVIHREYEDIMGNPQRIWGHIGSPQRQWRYIRQNIETMRIHWPNYGDYGDTLANSQKIWRHAEQSIQTMGSF